MVTETKPRPGQAGYITPATTATEIRDLLSGRYWSAFTLYGGQASDILTGASAKFEAGHQLYEHRDEAGRVRMAGYRYKDGSVLLYKRRPDGTFSLDALGDGAIA